MPKWTQAQLRAINEPSGKGNILVSAAAGSGKTAVLVERIVSMITRSENPVSIDRLLVVTFTEAASAEMKERIIARLNTACRKARRTGDTAKSRYLKEQMNLTVSADINTIDAFCLRVVKNNFHILGIDPNFGIMDKHESDMMTDDTLSELFAELYASEEEKGRISALASVYASNRDDEGLKSVVRKIYNFMTAFAEPEKWLREKADMYSEDMTQSVWIKDVVLTQKKAYIVNKYKSVWENMADQMLHTVQNNSDNAVCSDIPYEDIREAASYWGKLWNNVCMCRRAVHVLENSREWDEISGFYRDYISKKTYLGSAMNKIPQKKKASDEEWQSFYNRYDRLRDSFRADCSKLVTCDRAEFNDYVHAGELKKSVDDLAWLTLKFSEAFEVKKEKKNVKTFSDIEHAAYRLFSENENIRKEYAEKYEEILIDEYQDTNGLQDAVFTSISRDNVFMVGDLKQSIYRFRGGDPTIFKDKSTAYDAGGGKKITLNQNFRSRLSVLDSINSVFKAVMSDEVGDVDYDDNEALRRDSDRECYTDGAKAEQNYNSELHRIAVMRGEEETEDDVTADAAEAASAAERIQELVSGRFQVYDSGAYRDIEYRDIVILMRSVRSSGDLVQEALERRGIPSFVQKEEYFERREIRLVLALISVINNHMQDIPLISVMRSPIGGFSENELAKIKTDNKGKPFYRAVRNYKLHADDLSEEEQRLKNKCKRFTDNLNRWRGYVRTKPIAAFIWTLYEETGFYDFMGALEGGEEAQANLKLLYERAQKYEASGFKGIFNFIRYIERMDRRNEDISGAKLVSENHNVVRIMTVHKSKGLEFPVVIFMKTAKKITGMRGGGENRVMLHKNLGIGVDYYNYENMYCKKLMFNEYIKEQNDKESLSEEMRLMYVAMTRAKEKLIVTAAHVYKDKQSYEEKTEYWKNEYLNKPLPEGCAEEVKSYADWIIPAVLSDGKRWDVKDTVVSSVRCEAEDTGEEEDIVIEEPERLKEGIFKILDFKYKYTRGGAVPAKTSVTAIKEMEDPEHYRGEGTVYMTQKPRFLRTDKLGAEIGTAHHQVMAFINIEEMSKIKLSEYERFVQSEIERIGREGHLKPDIIEDKELTATMCANICGFFKSDMGQEVLCADKVYREAPFEIEIPACEYDGLTEDDGETIVVQGIIDLYFEDREGNLILVDYKTDRCKSEEEQRRVAEKYVKQIELYERAMNKIIKKSVKDKYLYLFSAQSVVKL